MAPTRHASLWHIMYFPFEFAFESLRRKFKQTENVSPETIVNENEENLKGKVVVVTGANSGLGRQAAMEVARRGAKVVMGCRNLATGESARKEIMEQTGSLTVELYHLDLSDLSSVRTFASELLKKHSIIDILINNAGISLSDPIQQLTKEGWDLQMVTNHLGHFLLTNLLINSILPSTIARVVTVSSTGCIVSTLDTDDIMLTKSKSRYKLGFQNTMPYCNSKLANALFTKSLAKRYPTIKAYSLCPGLVRTEILRQYDRRSLVWPFCRLGMSVLGTNVEHGVDTLLMCCVGKGVANDSGGFFRFGRRLKNVEKMLKDRVADKLWNVSEEYVGLN